MDSSRIQYDRWLSQPSLDASLRAELSAMADDAHAIDNAFGCELTFGTVGFRLSTSVVIKRIADTVQALKDLNLRDCLIVKESPNKDAMRALPLETLHAVGASLKQEDAFGYEIKREALAEVA